MIKSYPLIFVGPEDAKTYREAAVNEAARRAVEMKVVEDPKRLVVRAVKPSDLGITTEAWSVTPSGAGWVELASHTIKSNQVMAFYGFVAQNDVITGIKFSVGTAKVKGEFFFDGADALENGIVLFSSPIVYEPQSTVKIEVYAKTGDGTTAYRCPILGVVAEPAGETIGA